MPEEVSDADRYALDFAYALMTDDQLPKLAVEAELDGKPIRVLCATAKDPKGDGEVIVPLAIFMDSDLQTRITLPEGLETYMPEGGDDDDGSKPGT